MPPGISRSGAGACTTTPAQARQASFGRRVTSTRNRAGITSSRSDVSWPITAIAPRQQGQAVSSGSSTSSTRGRCGGSRPRPVRRASARLRRSSAERFSASASLAAIDAAISSKAKCSCSSGSRSDFRPNCIRVSFAKRCRSRSFCTASASHFSSAASSSARSAAGSSGGVVAWSPAARIVAPILSSCARRGNPPRGRQPRPIKPVEQRRELRRRQTHDTVCHRRPHEAAPLHLLPHQHQPAGVPQQDLWTSLLGLEGLLTNPGTPGGKDGGEANPTELHEGVQGAGGEAAAGWRQGAVGGGDGARHRHRAAQPVAHRAPGGRLGRGTGRPQDGAGGNAAPEARGEAARRGGGDPPQGGGFFRQGGSAAKRMNGTKFGFVSAERANHAVATLCRVVGVSVSGFYAWLRAIPILQSKAEAEAELRGQIGRIFAARRRVYGSPRVHAELRREGLRHSRRRVARLMRAMRLSARRGRRRTPRTTDSRHDLPVAPNRLDRNFTAERPNQVWLADISYIPTGEGFLYLAAIKDMGTREIVGWSMADHLRAELCIDALVMAIQRHHPPRGLVHHGDRGVQYASEPYRAVLERHGITQSMSRRGNCLDNAPMESFFASLKTEHVHQLRFRTREAAKTAVFEYIEIFYNRQRLHSAIGYRTPAEARASMEGITMRAAA